MAKVRLGGQEHFYWEPHTALVVPGEREVVVHYTTQEPSQVQAKVRRGCGASPPASGVLGSGSSLPPGHR